MKRNQVLLSDGNKTIKNKMWKMFTVNNNTVYWDKIDNIVNNYNN